MLVLFQEETVESDGRERISPLEAEKIYQAIQDSEKRILDHVDTLIESRDKLDKERHINDKEINAYTRKRVDEVRDTVYGKGNDDGLKFDVQKGKTSFGIFKFLAGSGAVLWIIEFFGRIMSKYSN